MRPKTFTEEMMEWIVTGKGSFPNLGNHLPEVPMPVLPREKVEEKKEEYGRRK